MWMINNHTPFVAERCWVRDRNGAEVWLVAVRATFDIEPDGLLLLAEHQEPVVLAPLHRGDHATTSLISDTDLPHCKAATDVLLHGHARALEDKPVTRLKVGMRVGNLFKEMLVTGDRYWLENSGGVVISDTIPFTHIPLTYERAFGGTDLSDENPKKHKWELRNPVGCGFATRGETLVGRMVPNVESLSEPMSDWRQRPSPIGFGPIAGHWLPRRNYVGTYDTTWEETRQPLLPADFDEMFYQSAPEDQQVPGFLKGGEHVELYNLTYSGRLSFHLPRISLSFKTNFEGGTSENHRAALHTVILKPDIPKVTMVWHTHLECHHKVLKLLSTDIRIKERILAGKHGKTYSLHHHAT